jgi:hypothetical protein
MQQIIKALDSIIHDYTPRLQAISEAVFLQKNIPGKWSKKEELGHLVDSAQTNIRRFVMAQYEVDPHIVYDQNKWVTAAAYQLYPVADLIRFWELLNKHVSILLKNIPAGFEQRRVLTDKLYSIEWLAEDYYRHLLHHLNHLTSL